MGLFRRGSIWWMDYVYGGKQYRHSTGTKDKKLAQRFLDSVKGKIAEGKWLEKLPGEDKTFREMMKKYLAEYSAKNKAPTSHRRDKSLADHLLQDFGDHTVAEVGPKLISQYKTKRRDDGASPRTVNYELALLSHAFNLAIREWEWIKENPVSRISKEKVNNMIERWMTCEEEQRLLNATVEWLQPILILGIETGLRQNELLNLKWSNVNLSRRTLTILEQKNKGKDTLELSAKAIEVLKAKQKVRNINNDLVFFNGNGNRIDARNLLRAFYSATRRAKIKNLRWHDATRHTFATRLVQGGTDIYRVQRLGRWRNISMVERYAHHSRESLRSGIEALDKFRKESSTNLAQSDGDSQVCNV